MINTNITMNTFIIQLPHRQYIAQETCVPHFISFFMIYTVVIICSKILVTMLIKTYFEHVLAQIIVYSVVKVKMVLFVA